MYRSTGTTDNTTKLPSTTNNTKMPSAEPKQQLDLVVLLDTTGSMGPFIEAAKLAIEGIMGSLAACLSLRVAIVAYKDHSQPKDEHPEYVTRVLEFTSDSALALEFLKELSPSGGGDGPEAVEDGLNAVTTLNFLAHATRVCILIGDAPPHGLELRDDNFPNGSPLGTDPFQVIGAMSQMGIVTYAVGCEPVLSRYEFGNAFFRTVAANTGGMAIELATASSLADVILGASQEAATLDALGDAVAEMFVTNPGLDIESLYRSLAAQDVQTTHLGAKLLPAPDDICAIMKKTACLKDFHDSRPPAALWSDQKAPASFRGLSAGSPVYRSLGVSDAMCLDDEDEEPVYRSHMAPEASTSSTPVTISKGTITKEQASRLYHLVAKRKFGK